MNGTLRHWKYEEDAHNGATMFTTWDTFVQHDLDFYGTSLCLVLPGSDHRRRLGGILAAAAAEATCPSMHCCTVLYMANLM